MSGRMFHFQTLDVYKCAVAFLPIGYGLANLVDGEMASQLRRAALSINLRGLLKMIDTSDRSCDRSS
jgi:hypothetical protein